MVYQLKNTIATGRFTFLWIILIFLWGGAVRSQQDAQYTQYMYNTVSINPGYAGSRENVSIAALHRSQWAGIDGAPTTQTFNVHAPIGYRGVGLGISIVNDKIGPTSETYFDGDFSYTIYTSREGRLSFGLKASAHLLDINFSKLNQDYTNPGGPDPTLQQNIDNKFSPNFGAGVYYYTQQFYLGLSVPRFLQTTHFDGPALSTATERMNFYLITGYVFELDHNWRFKPATLLKVVQGAPIQLDISANFMFRDKFILGAGYRLDAAVSALAGFQLSKELFIGMAYDRETSALGKVIFNQGSFELIARYDFISRLSNLKSPRFF
jgi:type IX secretion system PorP/SprF family membrane protein